MKLQPPKFITRDVSRTGLDIDWPARNENRRQALCYQCHAPQASRQAHSGDDRTPVGVHEGLSCLSCHLQHGEQTRASCDTCHVQHATCGLDVEKMDTTFKDATSKHNIHSMKCGDCHEKGVPKRGKTLVVGQMSK